MFVLAFKVNVGLLLTIICNYPQFTDIPLEYHLLQMYLSMSSFQAQNISNKRSVERNLYWLVYEKHKLNYDHCSEFGTLPM